MIKALIIVIVVAALVIIIGLPLLEKFSGGKSRWED